MILVIKLKKLKHLNETFKNHFDQNSLCYNELKSIVYSMMLKTVKRFDYVLKNTNEEEIIENIGEMKTILKDLNDTHYFLKSAVSCLSLHDHIQLNLIDEWQKDFNTSLKSYFENLLNIVNDQIKHLEESQIISNESSFRPDTSLIQK